MRTLNLRLLRPRSGLSDGAWDAAAPERVVPGRQFTGGQRPQYVKLVPVRVSHDHPADLALSHADLPRPERFQPGDLGGLIGRPEVKAQPVLDGLPFGNLEEHQVGDDALLRAAFRRLEAALVFVTGRAAPAQRRLPEAGYPGWVGGVNAQALDADFHALIILRPGERVQRFRGRPDRSMNFGSPRRLN